jgi:lambda repressor-like predicted transcriptional regulator
MMTKNEIKAELARRGIKYPDVARAVKPRPVSRKTVSVVINRHENSRPIQTAVAEILNMPYEKIWGKAA